MRATSPTSSIANRRGNPPPEAEVLEGAHGQAHREEDGQRRQRGDRRGDRPREAEGLKDGEERPEQKRKEDPLAERRSEERRVGKECRYRRWPYDEK